MTTKYLKLLFLFLVALSYASYSQYFNDINVEKLPILTEVMLTSPTGEKLYIQTEVALTDAERTQGLMHRKSLPENSGMLFVWQESDMRAFWMKNTYIPLDMIFIEGTKIVGIVHNTTPHSLQAQTVNHKANAVLEVNAGFAKKHGVDENWRVSYVLSQ